MDRNSESFGDLYLENDKNNPKITRFEVIDEKGRAYVSNACEITISLQDDGKTLKVFVKKLKNEKQKN